MELTKKAFKAYDVRGVVPTEDNAEMAYRVGRVFAAMFAAEKVVVGHDIRLSGRELVEARMEKFPCSGEINRKVEDSAAVLAAIEAEYTPGGQVDKLDGLSIDYAEWRFNVRVSNTEPVMRLNVETRGDKKLLAEKTAELLELIGGEEA